MPIPLHAVQDPMAAPRSRSEKTATMIASAAGLSSAPETPWRARAPMRKRMLGASAQSTEVTPNPTTPITKIRRSPKRSPNEPPMRMSDASVMR